MEKVKEKWLVHSKKLDFKKYAEIFNIDQVTARVIRNRGLITQEEFDIYLNAGMDKMYNPMLMKDMDKAINIISESINKDEKIRIIGDYDIDGVCSGYILTDGIRNLGGNVDFDVPDRVLDGYGINERLIRKAKADGVDLIVTCDNGISAINQAELSSELGIKLVITDHHEIPYNLQDNTKIYNLPKALAVVDNKREDCNYPYKELCGAGVAYKVIEALRVKMIKDKQSPIVDMDKYLAFAAIATVGDVVKLQDENRIFVKNGLKIIKKVDNIGLQALVDACGLRDKEISSYHIGFVMGPCINAAGRLKSAKLAYDLFDSKDLDEAKKRAEELKVLNDNRKDMTFDGTDVAIKTIDSLQVFPKVIVHYLADFHESIAGIVAGKLKEKYYRPSFVFTDSNGILKGSGRSIEGYSMYDELVKVNDLYMKEKGEPLIEKFGGHPMAAGLSIKKEKLNDLKEMLNKYCPEDEEIFVRKTWIDVPMPFEYITEKLVNELSLIEPYGTDNESPVFADKIAYIHSIRVVGSNKNVVQLNLENTNGKRMKATYFSDGTEFLKDIEENFGEEFKNDVLNGRVRKVNMNVLYYPEINEFRGNKSIQIIIRKYLWVHNNMVN